MTPAAPLIEGRGLTKVYGAATALADADIRVYPGEVRALIGSNGAGKSTLLKILTGAVVPTAGTVEIDAVPVPLGAPQEMLRRGVACIYQHSNLAPAMSVLDNIFLGRQPVRALGILDRRRQRREAEDLLARYQLALDLDAVVGALPTVKQKEVEIAKALAIDARVLLMDEPTGWLSATDVARLHATIRSLREGGTGIVYVSHMLDEIFAVCDTMTIMRDGRIIAEARTTEMTRQRVVELMVGEKLAGDVAKAATLRRVPRGTGKVRLSCRNLGRKGAFDDISFDLFEGEILCVTGLIGSKRSELLNAIFGSEPYDTGSIEVDGKPVRFGGPHQAMTAGIGFVPEDRHRDGLMLGLPVRENLIMATLKTFSRFGLLDKSRIAKVVREMIVSGNIQPPVGNRLVRLLSGGNQQKVLVGKWLARAPRILILDEPTVGVDVGAKAEIYAILRRERDGGAAVLVVSSDLEEVMTLSDRIAVMSAGRLKEVHDAGSVQMSTIVAAIGAET